jgi:ribosomal protein S18 acetylase RimI-like enzyme
VERFPIRRLGAGDEDVVARLAEDEPRTVLLADPATIFLAAFDEQEPVGFAFGYVLDRRHGEARMLFVYELDVNETHRRRGIATALMRELFRLGDEAGAGERFVLTEPGNDAANALYASLGGRPSTAVVFEWSPAG